MYCSKCGKQLPDNAKFCDECGTKVELVESKISDALKGQKVTENIVLGTDGKYHWYYEFKLMKNPTILFLLWKIFFWIFIGIWAMLVIFDLFGGRLDMDDFLNISKTFLLVLVGFEAFVAFGYFIYALLQGFKYCVLFEMDDHGVTHTQMQKQFKKAQAISFVTMFLGVYAGKPGVVGTGILAATKQSMSSSWSSVKSVEIIRKHDVIKVNERLNKNQVYALPEDFPFVEEFIKNHVGKKCSINE